MLQDWQIWVNKQTANKIINQDKILQKKKEKQKLREEEEEEEKEGEGHKVFRLFSDSFQGETNKQTRQRCFFYSCSVSGGGNLGAPRRFTLTRESGGRCRLNHFADRCRLGFVKSHAGTT